MMNVAIVGKMGAGKSSLANFLVDVHQYTRVANAGALKALAQMAYGPIDKSETYRITTTLPFGETVQHELSGREVLQGIGQTLKEFDRDIWLKAMVRSMETMQGPFVCDDTRFPFEAGFLKGKGWIIAKLQVPEEIRMNRYQHLYGRIPTEQELNHASETEVDNIQEDILLDGEKPVIDLAEELFRFMDQLEYQGVDYA